MKQGTIVLTPFPFTDLSTLKRRPAIIISKENEVRKDVIVAYISSKISEQISESDFIFRSSHSDFDKSGLFKDSIIKLDKLVTIDKGIFTGELGHVGDEVVNELLIKLRNVFGI